MGRTSRWHARWPCAVKRRSTRRPPSPFSWDVARREGAVSTPIVRRGTAFAAIPAIALGSILDPIFAKETKGRLAAGADPTDVESLVVVRPASDQYIRTYGARRRKQAGASPNLIDLQGTALFLRMHTALVGALGLIGVALFLRNRGVSTQHVTIASVSFGIATLWGPYSTVLFSHVTAGTALLWMLVALERADTRFAPGFAVLAGIAGSLGRRS